MSQPAKKSNISKMKKEPKLIAQDELLENSLSSGDEMMACQDPTLTSLVASTNMDICEMMKIIEDQKKIISANTELSRRVDKMLEKYRKSGVDLPSTMVGAVKKAWGIMKKGGALYRCLVGEDKKIIKESFRVRPGKKLEDIAELVTGTKAGRNWQSWKLKKGGDFVIGAFKWLTDL